MFREVKRKDLIVGNTYYTCKVFSHGELFYLGAFGDEINFYSVDGSSELGRNEDGTIPFLLDGSSFYEHYE